MISCRLRKMTVKIKTIVARNRHRIAQVMILTLMKTKKMRSMRVIKMMGIKVERLLKIRRIIVGAAIIRKKARTKHLGIAREVRAHRHNQRI